MTSASIRRTRQSGFATLAVTLILLFGMTIVLLYSTRGAVNEQRLTGNEVRAKQAFAAANAGIQHALSYMRTPGGIDKNMDGVIDSVPVVTAFAANASPPVATYKVLYCDAGAAAPACPATRGAAFACGTAPTNPSFVLAVSCGWSDDDTSVQRVVAQLKGDSATTAPASVPLISKGTANLLVGGATVMNYFNDLTVWSGGSMLGQSNTGKTFIRDSVTFPTGNPQLDADHNQVPDFRQTGNSPACNNPPTGYTCATQGSTIGHDVVFGDTRLSTLSSDGFFQSFFGSTPTAYRDNKANWVVDTTGTLSASDSTSIGSINSMNGAVIWVEGDMSLPTNLGNPGNPFASPPILPQPVILIVNGNLDMGSNSTVYGLVYVTGNVTGNGSPTIYGSMIVNGNANTTGNPKIIYDPTMLSTTTIVTVPAEVPGSWHDW